MSGIEEVVGEVNGCDGDDGDQGEEVNEEVSGEDEVVNDKVASASGAQENGDEGDSEEEDDDDGAIFEVECILKERSRKGIKEYLVRWKGYGEDQDTWEPSDNLNCEDAMEQFRKLREEEAGQSQRGKGRGKPRGGGGGGGAKRSLSKEEDVKMPPKKRGRPKSGGAAGRAKKRRSRDSSEEEDEEEAPLVIRCKTIFKKHLIENAIKFENRRTAEDDNNPDPKVRYFMRYDIDTGEVFVGDVKIEVDEVKKELVCSSCSKIYSEERSWEDKLENPNKKPLALWHIMREMKLHVIGFHLGGFTCPHCDEEEAFHTRGSTHFYRHMSTKHRDILDAQRSNKDID